MNKQQIIPIAEKTHPADDTQRVGDGLSVGYEKQTYLTTKEAAAYLRKSVSWLIRHPLIPYLPGKPNTYRRKDLDDWAERILVRPELAA